MVTVAYDPSFRKKVRKIKDHLLKAKGTKLIGRNMNEQRN